MIRENSDQTFLGKALVRKGRTSEGTVVITITGVFEVPNIDDFDDGDEMWVCRLALDEGIKHVGFKGRESSPEDFLMNLHDIQNPQHWTVKPGHNRNGRG